MKKLFILSVAVVALMASCKKKEATCDFNAASIQGKQYKITSYKINGQESLSTILPPCSIDDLHSFEANGVYKQYDIGTVCNQNNTTQTGTWSVSGNTFNLDGDVFQVSEFTCAQMRLVQTQQGVTYEAVLVKQ